jgi:hypothetical protein
VPRATAWAKRSSTYEKNASGAAVNGLGATIKQLRRTTSGAASNGLGTSVKYFRAPRAPAWAPRSSTCEKTASGAAVNGLDATANQLRRKTNGAESSSLGTTTKYLQLTTSEAVGYGLSRYWGLPTCPFTTSAPNFSCFLREFFANKPNGTAEVRGLGQNYRRPADANAKNSRVSAGERKG